MRAIRAYETVEVERARICGRGGKGCVVASAAAKLNSCSLTHTHTYTHIHKRAHTHSHTCAHTRTHTQCWHQGFCTPLRRHQHTLPYLRSTGRRFFRLRWTALGATANMKGHRSCHRLCLSVKPAPCNTQHVSARQLRPAEYRITKEQL